jgi:tetratricopeptide (TPR) repeat protein
MREARHKVPSGDLLCCVHFDILVVSTSPLMVQLAGTNPPNLAAKHRDLVSYFEAQCGTKMQIGYFPFPCELRARVRSWFRKLKPWLSVGQKEFDTTLNARIALANHFASLYIPGLPSPENKARCEQAINEFQQVLTIDRDNLTAIDGIGSLFFQSAGTPFDVERFEESKKYLNRHMQIRPNDPEPYYWVGVINWTLAYRGYKDTGLDRNREGQIKPADPLPAAIRAEYAAQYGTLIEEGVGHLQKFLLLRPDIPQAMGYLSLLYRRKADAVEATTEREALTLLANGLDEKIKQIQQRQLSLPPKIGLEKSKRWLH